MKGATTMYEVWCRNEFLGCVDNYEEAEEMATIACGEYDPDDLFVEDIFVEDTDVELDYDECGFNPYMGCYDYDC